MKNRILKILGVAVTLAMVLSLAVGFVSAPAASANPGETLNEWYTFDYPVEGEDGGWFMEHSIQQVGEITEAIDGTLYTHVQFCSGQAPHTFLFDVQTDQPGALTITQFGTSKTGTITADIDGTWNGPETDFVAFIDLTPGGAMSGTACIRGTITATNLSFQGSIEAISSGSLYPGTYEVDSDSQFYVGNCGGTIDGHSGGAGGSSGGDGFVLDDGADWIDFDGVTDIDASLFKSNDGGRSWEETDYPGGAVVDMATSSIDADTLYVTDGHYVYKTDDAGDTWDLLAQDSLETMLAGTCGIPPFCDLCDGCCPACGPYSIDWSCPITSIDVAYDADDNPFVFIGTRQHSAGVDLDEPPDGKLDCFPGDVLYIGEAGYPANWTSLNLPCFHGGGYDAIAVGCAPDWADSHETYVVVSDGNDTWVVYTKGTVCGWYEFAELEYDCFYSFPSILASRIGFPDDWEDTETLFVGVVDCTYCSGDGGDVYMATDGDAIDMNVAGIETGCVGEEPVDIISLDVKGDTDEASLIAGAFCDAHVYCSTDGGWSWDESEKDPTGTNWTYVIWYEDTALATTAGCECGVSMCCGEDFPCQFWNQISLMGTEIDCVEYIDHSPGYVCGDSETMFMVTSASLGSICGHPTLSVFRYDGTYWERVLCSTLVDSVAPYANIFNRVRVSPDFNTTNCVYLSNGNHELWRTTDAGCSWDKLTFPCSPRPCMHDFVIIDEDTVITGGRCDGPSCDSSCGYVFKTTRHGARPWDEYEYTTEDSTVQSFALEPGYEDPGSILLGDDLSAVYISEDGGENWDLVGDCQDVLDPGDIDPDEDTFVVFDPGYATNHIIYAAAGNIIARCIIDPDADWADQEWEEINFDYCGYEVHPDVAAGIAVTGDTALYVTDDESVGGAECGVWRSLNPDAEDAEDIVFEEVYEGLDSGTMLHNLWLTCDTSDDGCAENVLWALDYYDCENIWVYEDTLAQPVVLDMPVDEQKLTKTTEATLSWKALCDADCYEVSLYAYCPECPDQKLAITVPCTGDCCLGCLKYINDICTCTPTCTTDETCIVVDDLDPGTTYYWQVRVCVGSPTLSKWSEERSFTTAMMAVPFVDLCSPACGSQDIILTPNFAWGAVSGATGYEVQLSPTETFTAGVIKGKTTVNAWVCPTTLEYATTYYWRVRAEKDSIYSDWTYCMFTTMPEPVAPTPPVVVQQVPPSAPPVINIPPAKMITPTWIYAIIGVGAALAIVVIVLIVRTRRPPA
jgi:hypothetical protein